MVKEFWRTIWAEVEVSNLGNGDTQNPHDFLPFYAHNPHEF